MAESNQLVYRSRVRVKRKSGPMRLAYLRAEKEPVIFGIIPRGLSMTTFRRMFIHLMPQHWISGGWKGHTGKRKRVGIAINPVTPASVLEEILQDVDQVLVMTVNPGFGHQHFIHTTLPKIRGVRQMIDEIIPDCDIEVDGGIDAATAPLAVNAGANVLVAGSAIFSESKGVIAAMERLRAAANQAMT